MLSKLSIFVLNSLLAFAALEMAQARTNNALGVFISIMSDAFNMPFLFQSNVFQKTGALRALATWCAVTRLLNRYSKETYRLANCEVAGFSLLRACWCAVHRCEAEKAQRRGHRNRHCASSMQKLRAPPHAEAEYGPRGRLRASFLRGRVVLPLAQEARDLAIDVHHATTGGALLPCSL